MKDKSPPVRHVDLFCGAGGYSLGASSAGAEVALGVDSWRNALEVFRANHPRAEAWEEELGSGSAAAFARRLVAHMGGSDFHLHGSPPCQAVSKYNTKARKGGAHKTGEALSLTTWYLNVVRAVKPTTWSMEQVGSGVVTDLLARRRVPHALLDFSQSFGLPQTRRRVIAGGPEPLVAALAAAGRPLRASAAVLTGPLALPKGAAIQNCTNNTPLRGSAARRRRPGEPAHRPILPGEWARDARTQPAPTVTKCPHRVVAGGEVVGTLDVLQALALQGFPRSFRLRRADGVPVVNAHLLAGNAVPPPVGRAIARAAASAASSR